MKLSSTKECKEIYGADRMTLINCKKKERLLGMSQNKQE